ncbi:uncharacterized protein LOC114322644 [Camellia sinensis]|uniref:uncharacterized protein LOC114322644 n=1 Tax=Camellia sinensis TaxID=4442 RepID=UPI001036B5F9|nr:uncharacterized protein LOC114322644 [Camellia sinensis]
MTVDAEGSASGLLCIWDPVGQRGKLWECLLKLKEEFSNPWCIGGTLMKLQILERGKAVLGGRRKLKRLKIALQQWNSEVFGNVNTKLKQVEDELHMFDLVAEEREFEEEEKARRREARAEACRLTKMVDWLWLQKSRLNWNLNGDKNTRYFHVIVNCRQGRNEINSLTIGDVVFDDPCKVMQEVQAHFQKQFTKELKCRPILEGPFQLVRESPYIDLLEAEFSEEEIWSVVKGCDGNRAPGPDGFNLACFQKLWKVMKSDVLSFMAEFHKNSKLVRGINSSFITLVPKKENPMGLADYRPISLVGSLYKILTKVLSSRLKAVIPQIISENQSAFIGGRNILDGMLVANEVVDSWKKSRKKGLILKLDFEKAYDTMNWEFLFSMMKNFGFGGIWVEWIRVCITSVRLSVLVNGAPTEEFSPQRGLRQGDSPSPFSFNIATEGLSILLSRALDLGLIKWVKIGSGGLDLTHLQFTDDSLILCEANVREVRNLKKIMRCFEMLSGVARDLDKIQASFLWGGSELKRKVHLIKWKEVAKLVEQGGLGVKRVKEINDCLLLKWRWRFGVENKALWKRVICSKYRLEEGSWSPPINLISRFSKMWRDILSGSEQSGNLVEFFLNNCKVKVGNGHRVKFWVDKWCDNLCLKDEFPLLYRLAGEKGETLATMLERNEDAGEWVFQFKRKLYDWESMEAIRLKNQLEAGTVIRNSEEDTLVWIASKTGSFSVESVSRFIADGFGNFSLISKRIWKALLMVVMWSLWNHRNDCLFRDVSPSGEGVSDLIKVRMDVWFKEVFKDCRFLRMTDHFHHDGGSPHAEDEPDVMSLPPRIRLFDPTAYHPEEHIFPPNTFYHFTDFARRAPVDLLLWEPESYLSHQAREVSSCSTWGYGSIIAREWYMELPDTVRHIMDEAGFGPFCAGLSRHPASRTLMGAIVERWWDTTNSFHFQLLGA